MEKLENIDPKFWKNKKVLITGHTGFKGTWLSLVLKMLGAKVYGVSRDDKINNNFSKKINLNKLIKKNIFADINNFNKIKKIIKKNKPDILFHLAAQSIVLTSYEKPIDTFKTNVIGTLNVIEACKNSSVKTLVLVTSDKCYENKNLKYRFNEKDRLGVSDPYSTSKAMSEMIAETYLKKMNVKFKIATVRAGNIIGGGDFSNFRLLPDIIRSVKNKKILNIRSPNATRPWQHVLEAIRGYLILTEKLFINKNLQGPWNFGPSSKNSLNVKNIFKIFQKKIKKKIKVKFKKTKFYELKALELDSSKANKYLNWKPLLSQTQAINLAADWYNEYLEKKEIYEITKFQIKKYFNFST